ncbi:DUF1810 domain-containing protein [Asticcacaulis sp. YBE204]|uniref:DUF1810 domain-containing protein n=1 Tax=Asticcacaulis sp. YBE204 TaxID=1282363 RepID=UPI0003C409B0|nr:DUF1810 domain-containing protein [Asticcacaulis sp. YBE204]ESQ79408.1 hypothetical protein AEYBE204_10400 [Asticcacaulis sp. YBE204]
MSGPEHDPYHLTRFLHAQDQVYGTVLDELTNGHKESHWMWFIFPQLRGLGQSNMAQFFGISGLEEARAYLAHPKLGPRLHVTTQLAIDAPAENILTLFGSPDDMKFRSSMTLFAQAAGPQVPYSEVFEDALRKRCSSQRDDRTLQILSEV